MAGSIRHVTAKDGTFTFDLIENMGDAYEACEELFSEVARLRRIEKAAREVCRPYRTGETWSLESLRTALEGGEGAQEEA